MDSACSCVFCVLSIIGSQDLTLKALKEERDRLKRMLGNLDGHSDHADHKSHHRYSIVSFLDYTVVEAWASICVCLGVGSRGGDLLVAIWCSRSPSPCGNVGQPT